MQKKTTERSEKCCLPCEFYAFCPPSTTNITFGLTRYQLAQAHFLQRLAREKEALATCTAIKGSPKEPLSPEFIVAVQDIIATCEHALSTFTYLGGTNLSTLWKDTLDQSPGGPGANGWKKETYSDMLRSALNNEYWDLALQV